MDKKVKTLWRLSSSPPSLPPAPSPLDLLLALLSSLLFLSATAYFPGYLAERASETVSSAGETPRGGAAHPTTACSHHTPQQNGILLGVSWSSSSSPARRDRARSLWRRASGRGSAAPSQSTPPGGSHQAGKGAGWSTDASDSAEVSVCMPAVASTRSFQG